MMSVDLIIISDSKIQLSCGYSPPLQGNKPTRGQDITIYFHQWSRAVSSPHRLCSMNLSLLYSSSVKCDLIQSGCEDEHFREQSKERREALSSPDLPMILVFNFPSRYSPLVHVRTRLVLTQFPLTLSFPNWFHGQQISDLHSRLQQVSRHCTLYAVGCAPITENILNNTSFQ